MKFRFPQDVEGWLTEVEGTALYNISGGKQVLEVGSYYGRSTICIAQNAAKVASVDLHTGDANTGPVNTLAKFRRNLIKFSVSHKVDVYIGDFAHQAKRMPRIHYDLIFIDACHLYENVRNDIGAAEPLLKPRGIWAFHDYNAPYHKGVKQAVDEFLHKKGFHKWTADSILFVHT